MDNAAPYIAELRIHPIKAMEPVAVRQVRVLESGGLEGDRQFALFDAEGKFVNGKRHARIHQLRSSSDLTERIVTLRAAEDHEWHSFAIDSERPRLNDWLSRFFGFPVRVQENQAGGFPDDTDSPGPTIISTATLQTVASWFDGITLEQMRVRIRANIEIGGVPPFWEDRLYGPQGQTVRFRVGDVEFEGVNPCQRCVVPTRNPLTGEAIPEFAKRFSEMREQTLPTWAERSRFNHFYRLAINTRVPPLEQGRIIHVGDPIRVISGGTGNLPVDADG